ncbi:hypothetical protein ACIHDR_49465 [Nocardia sp. NPDC052278]|uniref:hypothetical protein n=1 Tax=unclassified Nocardia TaxID=2637762 RepID=UPI003692CE79
MAARCFVVTSLNRQESRMALKSLVRRSFNELVRLFRDVRDSIALITNPVGPLIRIFHYDMFDDIRPAYRRNRVAELVFSYHDTDAAPWATHKEILERQFELFNIGESHFAEKYFERGNRSLSVGDVVGIDNQYYSCDPSGWSVTSPPLTA